MSIDPKALCLMHKQVQDTSHLVALHDSLAWERDQYDSATTVQQQQFWSRCMESKQREIETEFKFLGMTPTADLPKFTHDELLAELMS